MSLANLSRFTSLAVRMQARRAPAAVIILFSLLGTERVSKAAEPSLVPSLIASSTRGWPQFRGPRRDGVSDEQHLLRSWPEGGPKRVWTTTGLGRGFSSPIIAEGRIFLTGDAGEELHLFALNLEGTLLWRTKNGASWKDPYPGARASVTFSDGRLYHENAHGRVACLDAANGREIWSVNVLEQMGGQNITWGMSECLLVDERAVYATAGGTQALLVALEKTTGKLLWKSEPLRDSEGDRAVESASYVSPILVRFGERHLIVGCSLKHLFCADAENGIIQWTRRFPTSYSVIATMPALVGDGLFMTAPHGKGGRLFRLVPPPKTDGLIGVEERWTTRLDTLQGAVVPVDGRLIGSFYGGRKGWAAVSTATGEVLFDTADFVKGAPLVADHRIYALCEDGWMLLLEAGTNQFEIRGRFRLANASNDTWAHPVVHGGRLYLRYHGDLSCYDVHREQ